MLDLELGCKLCESSSFRDQVGKCKEKIWMLPVRIFKTEAQLTIEHHGKCSQKSVDNF